MLVQLIIGILLTVAWVVWEWKFAKNPMVPKQIFQGQRIVGLAFFIAFVAGMNFYSLVSKQTALNSETIANDNADQLLSAQLFGSL